MTSVTIEIPDRYKIIVSDKNMIKIMKSYIIEEYLEELFQDSITKKELENNDYDIELNNRLKKVI